MTTPTLDCIALIADPPLIRAGTVDRDWMSATEDRFAHRCTPLTMANASGWEILNPTGFSATWTGGDDREAITIVADDPEVGVDRVSSLFGYGVLTFHPGYVFRTSPGWVTWCRGVPNRVKDGIQPLDGVVETDWLPFSFTMNWRFTRPGTIRFEKDEPFCFITLTPSVAIEAVQPRLSRLEDDPALYRDYALWHIQRGQFNAALAQGDPAARQQKWQKNYLNGVSAEGEYIAGEDHRHKRRLNEPQPAAPGPTKTE
ncbi:MAG: DUF6065 family protein [Caulobacteraceae bacterium]|nr:DUF6065 family protein [Caulobacteraceae bacterium]